jgi:signal transduction histidine kinase
LRRLRLQHRIVLAFVVVVLIATTASALVAASVTTRAMRARMESQLAGAAAILSRGGLALNAAVLQNARGIVGAEVVTFDDKAHVVATTVPKERTRVIDAAARVVQANGASAAATDADCGTPCLIVHRRIDERPGYAIALVAETAELTAATRAVTRAIALGAALSAIVVLIFGQFIVRRVTNPIEHLVQFARTVDPEHPSGRATVAEGEVGALAEAFNGMLDRLQHAQAALVRSEKMGLAGMLAARVAHDIRNPLASIKIQTQLLQARLSDADDLSTVQAVIHDIRQVESVISDLIELARPGDLNTRSASVNDVIQDALQQLLPQFSYRKIVVQTNLAGQLPDMPLDIARFRQALLNLLVNASEALPRGGEISIETRHEPAGLVINICDDGIGVDPQMLDKVFDPFVSTKREGVGLGLVNAKAVVEAHGGQLRLTNRQPTGTCASITLPIRHG